MDQLKRIYRASEPARTTFDDHRLFREISVRLMQFQMILESQEPVGQGPVQEQFDSLVRQIDDTHATCVERGFLPAMR